ncbi:MBL fold metallo-hydrolase [Ruminiclostridium cellobioparum]|jgi:hydroxyacylglutathione hydrolase|uniref:Beta-lactamase n=1 Tax=Ruminiclostridium cellobioparum subsp. termitidis CT1112 TaxID=1195236 RepID=S0FNT5_RUMCE|nr:MBL fold metallo-hydrolase [Ruminiclostridium cellobioparum]EMS73870.1 beta-lactamase [Ruminiclostridium cellobioparum subsp. termitidis CT1112]
MRIKTITGGMFDSCAYLICEGNKAVLIDAGVKSEKVIEAAADMKVDIEKIILTHGHIDHIVELDSIAEKTGARAYIHINDEPSLTDAGYNVSAYAFKAQTFNTQCEVLRDGSILRLGELELKVIHTPGHTPGSICIQVNNELFSGDTLFNSGYGRVDLPNGSFEDIYASIVDQLFNLPGETRVYPGHGRPTTIEDEKMTNPIKHAIEW